MKTRSLIFQVGVMAVMLASGRGDDDSQKQHARSVLEKSGAKLELVFPKDTYQVGEPIEVTMRYSCTSNDPPIGARVVTYDRGGRIMDFGFRAAGMGGIDAADPLKYLLSGMGGLRSFTRVRTGKPYEQKAIVNEWLIFLEPGEYDITGHSTILFETDESLGFGPAVEVVSAPQKIRITAADPEWQKQVLSSAREKLRGSPEDVLSAIKSLRYLVHEEATSLLVDSLGTRETMFDAFCGLVCLPDQRKVKDALLQKLESAPDSQSGDSWAFSKLFANSDITTAKLDRTAKEEATQKKIRDIEDAWRVYFAEKAIAGAGKLPSAQAAQRLVDAVADGGSGVATLEKKRLILQNARSLDASRTPYVIDLDFGDPQLIPELSAVAVDSKVVSGIRSAALVQLHKLGVDKFRDLIASDLMAQKPVLSSAAHLSIGDYRAEDIGKALLRNAADDDFDTRITAAEMIRDFGVGITTDQLLQLIAKLRSQDRFNSPELVEALALASPKAALPLLRKILAGQVKSENDFRPIAYTLISRLPNAGREVRDELTADEPRKERMVRELLDSARYTPLPEAFMLFPSSGYHRVVPGSKETVATYAPDLLRLAASDPSDAVRTNAARALQILTGFPSQNRGGNILSSQIPEFLPEWRDWVSAQDSR